MYIAGCVYYCYKHDVNHFPSAVAVAKHTKSAARIVAAITIKNYYQVQFYEMRRVGLDLHLPINNV